MTHTSAEPVTFVVTDIETDGHSPLQQLDAELCLGGHRLRGQRDRRVRGQPHPARRPHHRSAHHGVVADAAGGLGGGDRRSGTAGGRHAPPMPTGSKRCPATRSSPPRRSCSTGRGWTTTSTPTPIAARLAVPIPDRQIFRGGGVCLYTMAGTLRGQDYLNWGMQRAPESLVRRHPPYPQGHRRRARLCQRAGKTCSN